MVDEVKLQRLRARYLGAHGGEMYDPHFSAVAKQQFSGERRKWPFADVATLLGAPYRPDAANLPDFDGLDFAPDGSIARCWSIGRTRRGASISCASI